MNSFSETTAEYANSHAQSVAGKKCRKRLRRMVIQAMNDYQMIAPHDKIMVCISGGKDSHALLDLLLELQPTSPIPFTLHAVNLDQKQPNFPADVLPAYLTARNVPFTILEQDTYSVVKSHIPVGKTLCSLCSRLRRGALYRFARDQGMDKVVLGHHADDALETFLLNLFHGGQLKAMSPKLRSDDGENLVIRPLIYCRERDVARYAHDRQFPIIPCDLCGSQENLQRQQMKQLIAQWEQDDPKRIENLLNALQCVVPSHLLDRNLFDFNGLAKNSVAISDGQQQTETQQQKNTATHIIETPLG